MDDALEVQKSEGVAVLHARALITRRRSTASTTGYDASAPPNFELSSRDEDEPCDHGASYL